VINVDNGLPRRNTFAEATARYYAPHTRHLSTSLRRRNFGKMLTDTPRVTVNADELRRFSVVQVKVIYLFIGV
jgi:hypothetical protein